MTEYIIRKEPQDWFEDYKFKNGAYRHNCVTCGRKFYGNKYRLICRLCAIKNDMKVNDNQCPEACKKPVIK